MSITTRMSAHDHIPARGGASLHVLGDLVHVKVTTQQTAGAFSMFEIIVPPGGGPPLHCHAPCEAFHLLDGTLIILGADGAETPAGPGDTVFVAGNAPHSYRNPGPGNARFLVTLAPGGFEELFADLGEPAGDATEPDPLPGRRTSSTSWRSPGVTASRSSKARHCPPSGPRQRPKTGVTSLPATYAGGPSGIAPSCCIIVIRSTTPQCSRARPSSSNRMMSISCTSTFFPLGGIPMNSPW